MTKETYKTLEEKQIKKLVDAYVKYKKAEAEFKRLKDEMTKDIAEGKYESKYGNITKNIMTRHSLDANKLKDEHPEIDFDEYMNTTTYTSVTVQNLR